MLLNEVMDLVVSMETLCGTYGVHLDFGSEMVKTVLLPSSDLVWFEMFGLVLCDSLQFDYLILC
jgi:hypothetical protein